MTRLHAALLGLWEAGYEVYPGNTNAYSITRSARPPSCFDHSAEKSICVSRQLFLRVTATYWIQCLGNIDLTRLISEHSSCRAALAAGLARSQPNAGGAVALHHYGDLRVSRTASSYTALAPESAEGFFRLGR